VGVSGTPRCERVYPACSAPRRAKSTGAGERREASQPGRTLSSALAPRLKAVAAKSMRTVNWGQSQKMETAPGYDCQAGELEADGHTKVWSLPRIDIFVNVLKSTSGVTASTQLKRRGCARPSWLPETSGSAAAFHGDLGARTHACQKGSWARNGAMSSKRSGADPHSTPPFRAYVFWRFCRFEISRVRD